MIRRKARFHSFWLAYKFVFVGNYHVGGGVVSGLFLRRQARQDVLRSAVSACLISTAKSTTRGYLDLLRIFDRLSIQDVQVLLILLLSLF